MKYLILAAKDVQAGDVIFTNNGEEKGIQFCGRVTGFKTPPPHPEITELKVEVVVGSPDEIGELTTIGFRHKTLVGVAREDEFVDVDVAAILKSVESED